MNSKWLSKTLNTVLWLDNIKKYWSLLVIGPGLHHQEPRQLQAPTAGLLVSVGDHQAIPHLQSENASSALSAPFLSQHWHQHCNGNMNQSEHINLTCCPSLIGQAGVWLLDGGQVCQAGGCSVPGHQGNDSDKWIQLKQKLSSDWWIQFTPTLIDLGCQAERVLGSVAWHEAEWRVRVPVGEPEDDWAQVVLRSDWLCSQWHSVWHQVRRALIGRQNTIFLWLVNVVQENATSRHQGTLPWSQQYATYSRQSLLWQLCSSSSLCQGKKSSDGFKQGIQIEWCRAAPDWQVTLPMAVFVRRV